MQSPKTVTSKKLLNVSSLIALVAGGTIAVLPLASLSQLFIGIAIAFVVLTAANNLTKGMK